MSSGSGMPSPGFRGMAYGGNSSRATSNVHQRRVQAPCSPISPSRLGGAGDPSVAYARLQAVNDAKAKENQKIEEEKKRKKDEARWARHSYLNTSPGHRLGSTQQCDVSVPHGSPNGLHSSSGVQIDQDKRLREVRLAQQKMYDAPKK